MTNSYDFIGCAKRMGTVLAGRTEPSVTALTAAAHDVISASARLKVGDRLRDIYNAVLEEAMPAQFANLLDALPERTVVPIGEGRRAPR